MARTTRSDGMRPIRSLLLLVMACSAPAETSTPTPTNNVSNTKTMTILETITDLAAKQPFLASEVSLRTGLALEKTEQSNEYFTVFRSKEGTPDGALTSVEVRQPTEKSRGKGGIIVVGVAHDCVKRSDIGDRFGASVTQGGPPRPNQPDAPAYVMYRQAWGELRLGFSRANDCLVTVVFDAT